MCKAPWEKYTKPYDSIHPSLLRLHLDGNIRLHWVHRNPFQRLLCRSRIDQSQGPHRLELYEYVRLPLNNRLHCQNGNLLHVLRLLPPNQSNSKDPIPECHSSKQAAHKETKDLFQLLGAAFPDDDLPFLWFNWVNTNFYGVDFGLFAHFYPTCGSASQTHVPSDYKSSIPGDADSQRVSSIEQARFSVAKGSQSNFKSQKTLNDWWTTSFEQVWGWIQLHQ